MCLEVKLLQDSVLTVFVTSVGSTRYSVKFRHGLQCGGD